MISPQLPPPRGVPIIGNQDAAAKASIMQAVQQLSLGIYTRVAAECLVSLSRPNQVLPETLQELAKDSHTAAQAYFEGLGVATFPKPTTDKPQ